MADSTVVAVTAVVAGAVVSLDSPLITAWATTRGQARKFQREAEHELRTVLDDTLTVMYEVEREIDGMFRPDRACDKTERGEPLGQMVHAVGKLEGSYARLAIRVGDEDALARACGTYFKRAEGLTYAVASTASSLNSPADLPAQVEALRSARNEFVAAAHRRAGVTRVG